MRIARAETEQFVAKIKVTQRKGGCKTLGITLRGRKSRNGSGVDGIMYTVTLMKWNSAGNVGLCSGASKRLQRRPLI